MYIDQELCEKCLDCRPVCPMGAIVIQDKKVIIDYETCVECGVCRRITICPEGAIKQVDPIPYPRIVRAIFSDPTIRHESTGVSGRGTEEMKTNDITNNFVEGKIGFSIELGRPGVGAYLSDLEKVVKQLKRMKVDFAKDNPVMDLIVDQESGALRPEVLGEKVLSAIAEFIIDEGRAVEFITEMKDFLNRELESVATMSVISRADADGNCLFRDRLQEAGHSFYPNGKVNIGLALG
ncbi:MAG: 4Fe-4S binding protein [Thermodesulfobacteriota bacterium]